MRREGTADGAPSPAMWRLLPFFGLYVSFGATLGFLGTGAPLILRTRGVDLADIGLLQFLNLPLGLTFLWAGLVDRIRLPIAPHRVGWIVLTQLLSIVLLLVLALKEHAPLPTLFLLGVLICVTVATMDVALEALVVETAPRDARPAISSAKFCGSSIGGMLGSGAIIGSYDLLGWTTSVLLTAAIAALPILPILAYPERRLRSPEARAEQPGGQLSRFRALGLRVMALGLYFAALHAATGENGLALIDLGVPLATAGLVSGIIASAANLVMSATSAILVRRFGTVPLITTFASGLVLSAGAMAASTAFQLPRLGVAATVVCYLCSSGLGVPVFNMLYRWAEGPSAATDYAVLFGAAFFASMPVRVGAPAVAAIIGWSLYFTLAAMLYLVAFLLLRTMIARSLAAPSGTVATS